MQIIKSITKKISVLLLLGLCLMVLLQAIPSYAANYEFYVSIGAGSDTNTGSSAAPWKTLHHAIQEINSLSMATGDTCTLHVASGEYSTANNEIDSSHIIAITQGTLIIDGDDTDKPVIDAAGASYWADGLEIQGSNVMVHNLVIKNFAAFSSGIMISGSNNAVVNCDLQSNEYGVYITGAGSQSNIIEACDIHHNGYGVFLQETGTGNTIDNCQIYSNQDYGVKIRSSPDSVVTNNAIYGTALDGIYVEYSNSVILQNRVYENISFGILVQGCSPIIWQNRVYDNGDGIMVAGETYEASPQIWNNLIYETDTSLYNMIQGIGVESWDGLAGASPVIYHNTLDHGPYYGIHVGNSTTATIDPDIKYNIITNFSEGGIWCDGQVTTITPDYNDVWNNGTGGSFNYYGCAAGTNDISSDPQYAATGHALQPGSPCIDHIPPLPNPPYDPVSIDIDGTERPQGLGLDIGCYEYGAAAALPTVTTAIPWSITATSAQSGGDVTSDGGASVSARGVCWGTSPNPTISDSHTSDGAGTGPFASTITGLAPGTAYHVRAYATNSAGTAYGNNIPFTTGSSGSQYVYTLPGGTGAATDYRIFTVPLYVGTVHDLLQSMEQTLGFYSPTGRWRVFLYVNHDYYEINNAAIQSMPHPPGTAAWIISLDTTQTIFMGDTPPQAAYPLHLSGNSWHLIGLPWVDKAIDLAHIAVTDGTHTYSITDQGNPLTGHVVWEYTGSGPYSGYEQRGATDTLVPGTGYFFRVTSQNDVTVVFPPDNTTPQSAGNTAPDDFASPSAYSEEPPPPPGSQPAPDIKANGQDGSITVSSDNPVSVSVTLDPGAWAGRDADWWLAAYTPFSWYTYIHTVGWQPGIHRCIQTPLIPLSTPVEVLNMPLPKGHYIFYFAVDGNADGVPDATWMDSVGITVE